MSLQTKKDNLTSKLNYSKRPLIGRLLTGIRRRRGLLGVHGENTSCPSRQSFFSSIPPHMHPRVVLLTTIPQAPLHLPANDSPSVVSTLPLLTHRCPVGVTQAGGTMPAFVGLPCSAHRLRNGAMAVGGRRPVIATAPRGGFVAAPLRAGAAALRPAAAAAATRRLPAAMAAAGAPQPAPPAVRAWLVSLGPIVTAAYWPLVSDFFRPAHPQHVIEMHTVWPILREIADAAGYSARPAAERDFGSFIRSFGSSAALLRCMLRGNPGRVLLVTHPAADLPFVAGGE